MEGPVSQISACWLPGLPHLLHAERSGAWKKLADAGRDLARKAEAIGADSLVVYSTQWLSVLGTSFQTRAVCEGNHVDENWYELGDLPFSFRGDPQLGAAFVSASSSAGIPSRPVDYDCFPIDTGTLVALRFLNSDGKLPVSIVSSWVYADSGTSLKLGETMRETAARLGRRPLYVAVSNLTNRFFPDDIDPTQDQVSRPEDQKWAERVLAEIENGNLEGARNVPADGGVSRDMQFNAFHWLCGVLGPARRGRVMAYGPLWGTGAAVIDFLEGANE